MTARMHLFYATAMAMTLAALGPEAALAQTDSAADVSEVVVTGSYIRGTPEDAALPVDVLTAEELGKQGSPTTVELLKRLPSSAGVFGESNQFAAGYTSGTSNVNLRGLGAARTLVLFNGRRLIHTPVGQFVDTNMLPSAAIGRIEVLKDGAAATYGSDAIGGVVNFITKTNLSGLDVGGTYTHLDGSDGDYTAYANLGWRGERANALISAGLQHRSQLRTLDRPFTDQLFTVNSQGGWSSAGNPGVFLTGPNPAPGPFTQNFVDPGCALVGGFQLTPTANCQFHFAYASNLVEMENRFQLYGEVNADLTDDVRLHVEGLWAKTSVPDELQSPSHGPNQYPTARTSPAPGFFYVPANNPGLIALVARNPTAPWAANLAARGAVASGTGWRPYAWAGNPLWNDGSKHGSREYQSFRLSASLTGELPAGIGWDTALTYMQVKTDRTTWDVIVSRLQEAIMGFGGAACNRAANVPGANGCEWFNPFSTAIPANFVTGQVNPGFAPGTQNSRPLAEWLFGDNREVGETNLLVADAVLNGVTPWKLWADDNIAWAAGVQMRWSALDLQFPGFSNLGTYPCIDLDVRNCAFANGPLTFFGGQENESSETTVYSLFGEARVPITDTLEAQLAIRHERYQGQVGSTTNPKLSLRWQATDVLAFRTSIGSTFRAPPATDLSSGFSTGLIFTTPAGSYRAYDNYGNPNLRPEQADTFSVGAILDAGGFFGTVDFWRYKFEDRIQNEPATAMVSAIFPSGAPSRCADPAYAALRSRFTFQGGVCSGPNILRVRYNTMNGPAVETSGIDVSVSYEFEDLLGGEAKIGVDASYVQKFEQGEQVVEGVVVQSAFDAVGGLNYQTLGAIPQEKGSAYAEYTYADHNIRWTVNYVGELFDNRSIFATNPLGRTIKSFVTHDLTYRGFLPWDVTLTAAVINVFDEDPPFARLDLSYDPSTANALGRYFRLGLSKRF